MIIRKCNVMYYYCFLWCTLIAGLADGSVCLRPLDYETEINAPFEDVDINGNIDGPPQGYRPAEHGHPRTRALFRTRREAAERELDVSEGLELSSASEELLGLISSDTEDEEMIESRREARSALAGATARYTVRRINTVEENCISGFYCQRSHRLQKGKCSPINVNGMLMCW